MYIDGMAKYYATYFVHIDTLRNEDVLQYNIDRKGDCNLTEKKRKAKWQNDYISKTYDRINLTVPKGRQADIKAFAESKRDSVNGYINGLIRADMGLTEDEWKGKGDAGAEEIPD